MSRFFTAQPQPKLVKEFGEHPPVQGMDGTLPLYNMPSQVGIYLYNIMPGEYGNRVRQGYRVWAQNLGGDSVRSIIPFSGKDSTGTESRLFAATTVGIYDVTTQGQDNPAPVVTFPIQTDQAGFVSFLHFTDPQGRQTILVADSVNGLYEYDPQTPGWTKYTTEITGCDPAKVAFLVSHKGRLWMIENDSSDAWYLPVGQKAGQASRFQFGSKMRAGGYLVGLFNWTIDGGAGLDDYLLAVSKGGDVMAYRGADPAFESSWQRVGTWYIGEVPAGRRITVESGGDTILLSTYGLTSVSGLLQGTDPNVTERNLTGKITRLIRNAILNRGNEKFWEVKTLAEEGAVVINSPVEGTAKPIQYVLNLNRINEGSGGGWGLWRGIPANTFEGFQGEAYFGTEDGRVCQMSGSLDEVDITGTSGAPVEFSMLTRYTDYGYPGEYKQVQFIRPAFITSNVMNFEVKAVYDFDLGELPQAPALNVNFGAKWDISLWDEAIWTGLTVSDDVRGGAGYGRNVAIAIRGSCVSTTTLINIEGNWQKWDFL